MKKFTLSLMLSLVSVFSLQAQYQLEEAFPQLQFAAPVDLVSSNDSSHRLFVVSQPGQIYVFPDDSSAGNASLFLDISAKVMAGGERGLLGMALHPAYSSNGYFFVNYTRAEDGATVIARYQVSETNPDAAQEGSEQILLLIPQPEANHNGGALAFGPDGYLYIAMGDGGGGGDPQNNAQNRSNLLGSILRIDVNHSSQQLPYAIPADNPYAGNTEGLREEIFAYGLRNPWKMSFDTTNKQLWVADVGQSAREEINLIASGGNYGWRVMEGTTCFNPSVNCDTTGLVLPFWEYTHASGAGRSITGGYVYRGSKLPELQGKYIYGDFVSGRIWALQYEGTQEIKDSLLLQSAARISSFGLDSQQELLVCSYQEGKIYKLVNPTVTSARKNFEAFSPLIYPNPNTGDFTLQLDLYAATQVSMTILDITGKKVVVPFQNKLFPSGSVKELVQLPFLPKGVYFYELKLGSMLKRGKLIVNK